MFYKSIIEKNSPSYQLLMLLILFFVGLFLSSFLFAVFLIPFYGFEILENLQSVANISDYNSIFLLKMMQLISSIGSFIIPPLLIAHFSSNNLFSYLAIRKSDNMLLLLVITFLLIIISQPIINFTANINSHLVLPEFMNGVEQWMKQKEDEAAMLTEAFLKVNSTSDFLLNLFIIGVLPAIGEELVFRGVMQKLFIKITKNIHTGIWITAIIFSAIHFEFYGFLPRMLLGAMFGYLFYWSGSIVVTIWAHFVNNGMGVLLAYLVQKNVVSSDFENLQLPGNEYMWVLASTLSVSALLYWVYKHKNPAVEQGFYENLS
ncbi:MAG: hypothetical protein A3K10_01295 [Bacteroidetes bacterium RIFCSPLOWO2_12_FULL_31_6]|nr:MAG: hypothetical protein A3K10_01295 [Bacteroidetes bacterium RIFCSPLOWO2_12_FULL_31_6]